MKLSSFLGVEAGKEFGLDGVGVLLEFLEVQPSGGGDGDDVTTPVGRVGLTVDPAAVLQAVENTAYIVAVDAEAPADLGLTERPELLQCRQDSEIGAGAQRHVLRGQPGAEIHAVDESVSPGELERLSVAEALFLYDYAAC